MNKKTVTIGIAAYNSERNIGHILESLLLQKEKDFVIEKIIVHSDQGHDSTAQIVKSFMNPKIKLMESSQRRGFSGSVKILIENSRSDINILLNDDIKIADDQFVEKLIKPFEKQKNVGLVCGNPQPLRPETFIEKAVNSTCLAYYEIRKRLNNGNNEHGCDGKTMALSKEFVSKLKYPSDFSKMGCVDAYLYFLCISNNFKFIFASEAIVYFRNPSTLKDYVQFVTRNDSNKGLLKNLFDPELVEKEYYIPKKIYLAETAKQFFKNPAGCLTIFLVKFYTRFHSKKLSKNFDALWETVSTTKNL